MNRFTNNHLKLFSILAIFCLTACTLLNSCRGKASSNDKASSSSQVSSSSQAQENEIKSAVTQMYNDIIEKCFCGRVSITYAYDKYTSDNMKKFLEQVNEVSSNSDVDILGWDCDPWIFAQDFSNPKAEVVNVNAESDSKAWADVSIDDFGSKRTIRLELIKEKGQWKVNDFRIPTEPAPSDSYRGSLKKEMEGLI